MMSQTFKVGDTVLIAKTSTYYGECKYANPADVLGEITSIMTSEYDGEDSYTVGVDWDTGHTNHYRIKDLVHYGNNPLTKELSSHMKI